jgi:Major royal jelly protein
VCFPYWSDDHTISVAELTPNGTPKAYPDIVWNQKSGAPENRWVCVQSVVVDDTDALWVLDPAAPKTDLIVKGGPKLVKIDMATNKPVQTVAFESIAPEHSSLNDVHFDTATGHAFITESGVGAIIVVDLKKRAKRGAFSQIIRPPRLKRARRFVVDGMKIVDPKTGKAPAFHSEAPRTIKVADG